MHYRHGMHNIMVLMQFLASPICRLMNKEYATLGICFSSMAGTEKIGGVVVTVRISHAPRKIEKK